MRTIGTQKPMSKINLLPKVEEISEVQEIIPKKWRNKFFFGKLNRLFPTTEEQIQQDHEVEELPLPNHEKIMEHFNKGQIAPQLQLFNGG